LFDVEAVLSPVVLQQRDSHLPAKYKTKKTHMVRVILQLLKAALSAAAQLMSSGVSAVACNPACPHGSDGVCRKRCNSACAAAASKNAPRAVKLQGWT
jgi:hypothetical protein